MQILDRDIALDMGTAGVALYVKGKGITNRQPTLVAVDKYSGKLLSVGVEALNMLGRTPASIVPIRPIVGGAISDYDMTVAIAARAAARRREPQPVQAEGACLRAGQHHRRGGARHDRTPSPRQGRARSTWLRAPSPRAYGAGLGRLQARRPPDNRHRRRHHGDGGGLPGRRIRVREHKDSRRGPMTTPLSATSAAATTSWSAKRPPRS